VLEVGGNLGYVRMEGGSVRLATSTTDGKWIDAELECELSSPLVQFLSNDVLDGCGMEDAKRLTKMMEEAYKCSTII
jgi:hypothetical protein